MEQALYNPFKHLHYSDITLSSSTQVLLHEASQVYFKNFDGKTWYGRCIFLSWYCSLGDCTFCFRSTGSHKRSHPETSLRSLGLVLVEAFLCKGVNWSN